MNVKSPWNVYRTRFLVRACQLTEPLTFTDALGREHAGEPGDYLVETYPGIRPTPSQTLLEAIYVPPTPPVPAVQECPAPNALTRPAPRPFADHHLRAIA